MFNGIKTNENWVGYLFKMEYSKIVSIVKSIPDEIVVIYVNLREEEVVRRMLSVDGIQSSIIIPGCKTRKNNVAIAIRGCYAELPTHNVALSLKQILFI